jgi:hypothetical protein
MNSWIVRAEAEECRLLAVDLAGRPEEPFLLRLASAFEDLHVQPGWTTPDVAEREVRPNRFYIEGADERGCVCMHGISSRDPWSQKSWAAR